MTRVWDIAREIESVKGAACIEGGEALWIGPWQGGAQLAPARAQRHGEQVVAEVAFQTGEFRPGEAQQDAAFGDPVGDGFAIGGGEIANIGKDENGKRSEEHTSELQSLMRISYAVFCLKKKKITSDSSNAIMSQLH